jgi:PAS domain S-box-containing protein
MRTRSITKQRARPKSRDNREKLFEQLLNIVCVGGFDGYLKRVSPTICAAFGYCEQEMTAVPMIELVHPDDRPWAAAMIQQFAEGRASQGVEVRIRAKDGTYKWILWDAVACVEERLFFATGQDITARKRAEEELRESNQRFERIASATNEAVWDWDLRTDRIWRNEAFHKTFGVPNDEVQGTIEWWRQRVHPDDLRRVLDSIPAPIVAGKQQWTMEYRLRRLDGTYARVYDRGFVIFDREGQPARMVGAVIEISKLEHAEERLRESEERFRLAAKATRDAIWDWDMRRGRVWRSEGFESLFGYSTDSVSSDLGWWIERIHPDDRKRVCGQVSSVSALRSEQYECEYRFRRADGSYADVYERGFVMYGEDDKPVRMVGSLMDMSARRKAQEMAHMQQAELAHIARVSTMGEIATGLAHELNQPLAAIANYAASCTQALAGDASAAREKLPAWIEKIAANTHRAGEIIRRLRGFTRKSESRRTEVDVNDLVRDVIDLMEAETRRRNMRVRWQPDKSAQVCVDPVQIQQVLVNLLNNAYEAAADKPPERRLVTVAVKPAADTIEVSVADLGVGIPAKHRERVFEAFFTTKASGVGVGLAISRSIVEDHGGRLWLSPNSRQGVTFHFTLPISGPDQ